MFKTLFSAAALSLFVMSANAGTSTPATVRVDASNGVHQFVLHGRYACVFFGWYHETCYRSYSPMKTDRISTHQASEVGFRQGKFRSQ